MTWVSNARDESWSSHAANAAWARRSIPTSCLEGSPVSGRVYAEQWALIGTPLAGAS